MNNTPFFFNGTIEKLGKGSVAIKMIRRAEKLDSDKLRYFIYKIGYYGYGEKYGCTFYMNINTDINPSSFESYSSTSKIPFLLKFMYSMPKNHDEKIEDVPFNLVKYAITSKENPAFREFDENSICYDGLINEVEFQVFQFFNDFGKFFAALLYFGKENEPEKGMEICSLLENIMKYKECVDKNTFQIKRDNINSSIKDRMDWIKSGEDDLRYYAEEYKKNIGVLGKYGIPWKGEFDLRDVFSYYAKKIRPDYCSGNGE